MQILLNGRVGARGIIKPHTEGTEAQSFLGHRGELALAGRTQRVKRDGGEEGSERKRDF